MYAGRKLLFHRLHVDDSIGTYATDYALAGICFALVGFMTYKIYRRRIADEANHPVGIKNGSGYWLPWNWPKKITTSVTMATFATVLFVTFYGTMAGLAGLTHEFLQEVEPYSSYHDGMAWLILWRCGAASSIIVCSAFLVLCDQICQQESFLALPTKVRKIFCIALLLITVAALLENFVRVCQDDPYNIDTQFLIFMGLVFVYGIVTLAVVIRSLYMQCRRSEGESESHRQGTSYSSNLETILQHEALPDTRWDLILHCICPWLIAIGGVFSFLLTHDCSQEDDPYGHDCPLPNTFNHNAVMHIIHALAVACAAAGENFAINRRAKICELRNNNRVETNRRDSTQTVLLV